MSSIYNIILIVINYYIKVARYLLIIKIVNTINIINLLYYKIFLKFN